MVLTLEQRNLITDDFVRIFQGRYGEQWLACLTQPLRPSPIYDIARQRQVKVSDVRHIRSLFKTLGYVYSVMVLVSTPIRDESQWTFFDHGYPNGSIGSSEHNEYVGR